MFAPSGAVSWRSFETSREASLRAFAGEPWTETWPASEALGYRCVPVQIDEKLEPPHIDAREEEARIKATTTRVAERVVKADATISALLEPSHRARPRIYLAIDRTEGPTTRVEVEGNQVTPTVLDAAENLLHTLRTGAPTPLPKGLYDLVAQAFSTTRDTAKVRILAAMYGMYGNPKKMGETLDKEDLIQHELRLDLADGAHLQLLYFSDRELRWIFSYTYVSTGGPGEAPEVINEVRLVANYIDGLLEDQLVLSMHCVIPKRLGQKFFAGLDISPGAKTYLEFRYERAADAYHLIEICKGATRLRLDKNSPGVVKQIAFPFPVPGCIILELGKFRVPFRTNADDVAYFDLPERTRR